MPLEILSKLVNVGSQERVKTQEDKDRCTNSDWYYAHYFQSLQYVNPTPKSWRIRDTVIVLQFFRSLKQGIRQNEHLETLYDLSLATGLNENFPQAVTPAIAVRALDPEPWSTYCSLISPILDPGPGQTLDDTSSLRSHMPSLICTLATSFSQQALLLSQSFILIQDGPQGFSTFDSPSFYTVIRGSPSWLNSPPPILPSYSIFGLFPIFRALSDWALCYGRSPQAREYQVNLGF
ncbi:hypothetical protein C8J56DRAFT_1030698 [Mycena floridula]|nr:hypothetical protein C8J56DRAFT_1030698 [Mycena floridula]